jgi:tripartite-type tricarboxylate transporter receptor subunit TctC
MPGLYAEHSSITLDTDYLIEDSGMIRQMSAVVLAAGISLTAFAQSYPDKPIRWIIGLPAGGGADVIAREVATRLGTILGQQVLVDNRPGSAGLIAGSDVAKAAPDGLTLMVGSMATHAIFPSLYQRLPYDPVKDFTPISMMATLPNVLVASPAIPVKTVVDFIAYAKARPGKLSYASAGTGSSLHLSMELFKSMTGTDIVHVPYKGGVLALADLVSGQVQAMFEILPTELPNIKAGKVHALGISTVKRSSQLPDVPSIAEAGVPGFDVTVWYAMYAPAKLPATIAAKLNAAMRSVLENADLRNQLSAQGADAVASSPETLSAVQAADTTKWTKVIRDAAITPE